MNCQNYNRPLGQNFNLMILNNSSCYLLTYYLNFLFLIFCTKICLLISFPLISIYFHVYLQLLLTYHLDETLRLYLKLTFLDIRWTRDLGRCSHPLNIECSLSSDLFGPFPLHTVASHQTFFSSQKLHQALFLWNWIFYVVFANQLATEIRLAPSKLYIHATEQSLILPFKSN